jgi:hypothetical protein
MRLPAKLSIIQHVQNSQLHSRGHHGWREKAHTPQYAGAQVFEQVLQASFYRREQIHIQDARNDQESLIRLAQLSFIETAGVIRRFFFVQANVGPTSPNAAMLHRNIESH